MSEFDQFSENYTKVNNKLTKNLTGFTLEYFNEYKVKDLHAETLLRKLSFNLKILDFGCGVGNSTPHLRKYFPYAIICGSDVSSESLKIAKEKNAQYGASYYHSTESLPFKSEEFDIIFSACVFHHIPKDSRLFWLKELNRVLKPNGLLFIYEHNPINPATQIIFRTAEFDKGAIMLSARNLKKMLHSTNFTNIIYKYRAYFPKWLKPLLKLEKYITKLPLGAQYYIVSIKK